MRAGPIVQQRLRTPTGPFFARCFIGIILGLVAEFAFMRVSTRLMMSSFAARWIGREQIVGWKFQHGCVRKRPVERCHRRARMAGAAGGSAGGPNKPDDAVDPRSCCDDSAAAREGG